MKISITIDCDDELQDVKTHLSVIREQVVKAVKWAEQYQNFKDRELSDSNCYGTHEIKIEWEPREEIEL